MLAALRRVPFGAQILLSLVLGVVLGLVAVQIGDVQTADGPAPNWLESTLGTVGSAFVTLLRTIVPPLVFLAIVASIANLRQVTNAARLAGQTLLWFAITALVAVGIGITLGLVLQPGRHTDVSADSARLRGHGRVVDRLPHRPDPVERAGAQRLRQR